MPPQMNDPSDCTFLAHPCISDLWSPNQTRRLIRVAYIPLQPKVYTSSVGKEAELTMVCPTPLPSMAPPHPPPPLRYIVDCLHIWPLPRGRIHFGWHRCILTDWSFWFGSRGNSLHFSFIVNLRLVWSKIHQWKRSNICDSKYLVFAGWLDLNSWSWGEVAI